MKRTVFIIIGSIVLLLVFSLWVYLLLFGAPKEINEAFTNLGFGNPTPIEEYDPALEQTAQLNLAGGALSQLTTRPVAGFAFVENASSTQKIRYVEQGTGHVYEIDLLSGVESRVSGKTHLAVTGAVFAPDGQAVALQSETETGEAAVLEELGSRDRNHELPSAATEMQFISSTTIRYLLPSEEGAIGYSYDLNEMTTDEIFSLPLADVSAWWTDTDVWLFNAPAPRLRGGLYRIENDTLLSANPSAYALSAVLPPSGRDLFLVTAADLDRNGNLSSTLVKPATGTNLELPFVAFPDKCAFSTDLATLWCASTALELERNAQSDWYKGLVSYSDHLWTIDTNTGRTALLENLMDAAGREIDVIDLSIDQHSHYILFKNKHDDTLWLRKLAN